MNLPYPEVLGKYSSFCMKVLSDNQPLQNGVKNQNFADQLSPLSGSITEEDFSSFVRRESLKFYILV
jgi:hypothetical protein